MSRVKLRAARDGTPLHTAVRCTRGGSPSTMTVDAAGMCDDGAVIEWWTCDRCGVTVPWVRGHQLQLPHITIQEAA